MPVQYNFALIVLTLLALVMLNGQALWCLLWILFESVMLSVIESGFASNSDIIWALNATADFSTAALVLCVPITPGKIVTAAFFVPMMIAHSVYAVLMPTPWTTYYYLVTLSVLAWLQALFLGGWVSRDALANWRSVANRWRDAVSMAAAMVRVGGGK